MRDSPDPVAPRSPKFDADELRELEPLATRRSFVDGEMLLEYGQADAGLFVVEAGGAEVINPADGGRRLAVRGPGDFIGDIDLLTRRPVVYSVRATGDGPGRPTRVLHVPADGVRHLINAIPHIGEKLVATFRHRRQALDSDASHGVHVVGKVGCAATHHLREFLHKNFVPFYWTDADTPAGRAAVRKLRAEGHLPAVDYGRGKTAFAPSLRDVARATGVLHDVGDRDVEFAVVGAGPAGIAAAVYAASEGVRTLVIDRLGPGGQIGSSSRIENFIGFPSGLSGTDLATRGVLQMLKFGAELIAPVGVRSLIPANGPDGRHELVLDDGNRVRAKTVLACTGVFWRRLPARNAERFERNGVYYTCTAVEAGSYEACDVAVVGGGNSAGQAVMFLADRHPARRVHLIVRRPLGLTMSEYLGQRIEATANVTVHTGTEVTAVDGDTRLRSVEVTRIATGERSTLPVGAVFVFIGATPHGDWLPDDVARDAGGYVLTGTDVIAAGKWPRDDRPPCPLETSVPGLLAGGDVRAGSTKRVGFAVGDGSLAVTCAHRLRGLSDTPAAAASAGRGRTGS